MHTTTYLKDYRPPAFTIDTVGLRIDLNEESTTVTAVLSVNRAAPTTADTPLVLAGEKMRLLELEMNGVALTSQQYTMTPQALTIARVPDRCCLKIVTLLRPQDNTALEGLYKSGTMFCTQCEAQGFRKITYFLDQPDILARYTTTITADRTRYPVLLANGNRIDYGDLEQNRHYAVWEDPFPKPSYLFAMVAGDLACREDYFTTASGRRVRLSVYTEHHNADRCDHALAALGRAMRWDEEKYGLEYDLDQYMIVAVDDFNMGAMENKGLNIFNSKYVLCTPETATDDDYEAIEGVIAHEYFHNWTGNRVTCRDWFQLSLKEGLTVFRDQEFSADMTSRGGKRVHDVRLLWNAQFPEDAGPMSHPVRPDSYIEINNFYTVTVYEKGAEVIRMLHTLMGEEKFRAGLRLYLERHDGTAATCDDFLAAMAEVSGLDLDQFARWYSQAGTPRLLVSGQYDPQGRKYTLTVGQKTPPTPGQEHKKALHLPLALGLLLPDGSELPLRLEDEPGPGETTRILDIRNDEQQFVFIDVPQPPVPSLLRGYSAPVILEARRSREELAFLLQYDSDPFCRWEAGQRLLTDLMLALVTDHQQGRPLSLPQFLPSLFADLLTAGDDTDPTMRAQLLTLPTERYLAEQMAIIDPDAVHQVHRFFCRQLGRALSPQLLDHYHQAHRATQATTYDQGRAGLRRLKNCCLTYLVASGEPELAALAHEQFTTATTMTDSIAALRILTHFDTPFRHQALQRFAQRWQNDSLVMDKWLAIQATSPLADTLTTVQALLQHRAFSLTNPNRVRALLGSFSQANQVVFHAIDGSGYRLLGEQLSLLDPINGQITARLLSGAFSRWRRFDTARQQLMTAELEKLHALPGLSRDSFEVIEKCLAAH